MGMMRFKCWMRQAAVDVLVDVLVLARQQGG
jgi:hypothetical protein